MTRRTIKTTLLCSTLLLGLVAVSSRQARAFEALPAGLTAPAPDDDSAYAAGTRAMDDHRWWDAIREFDKVIAQKGSRTDAALYWKAYSLRRSSRRTEATATCDLLRAQFPQSSWNKDCGALVVEVRVDMDNFVMPPMPPMPQIELYRSSEPGSDADLKMLALNGLLNQDPARAIPLLRGILAGNQPISVKKHAIFVLAQSKSPEAQSILHDAATGKMNAEMQREAIQAMGVFQGKRADETLAEVYRTTTDTKVKKSVIQALFIAQDAPRMVELARAEKDLDLKRALVSQLSLMNDKTATDYMIELLK